ncbi:MAG TPA: M48 family metalloprotease [Longimicrobiales bacterium]|nr:M48 family metalloprotease [Longimicrobiales bacterium]
MMRKIYLLAATSLLAACATNPATGRREISLVSESQEIQMGQEAAQQVEQSLGLVKDAELQAYVRRIGGELARQSERPQLPWRFGVIDDPTPNAFALPGGPVYITRGLMNLMSSEAELASVLGHEIGHITARHSAQMMTRAQLGQIGLIAAVLVRPELAQFGDLLSGGMQLLFLKYGRDAERQADELGFKYALTENYDVSEMDDVFLSLQRLGEIEGRSGLPSWASTHPDPGERANTTRERVAALPAPAAPRVTNEAAYMNQIDGLVYGDNPRQGFFRNGEFLHPDLRFRLGMPNGWKTQNMPSAVVAVSPQRDAVVQLQFAQGTPTDAARRFFSQQGMQQGQNSSASINGNPAYSSYFQAQTQQGVVAGLVTWVSHNSNTYQILSYTSGQQLRAYDNLFRSVAGSFATLTDPSALNVRPNVVDIVQIPSAMTLTQFNQRYPSVIPIAELAIINQVEANATLPSRTRVKRVVNS